MSRRDRAHTVRGRHRVIVDDAISRSYFPHLAHAGRRAPTGAPHINQRTHAPPPVGDANLPDTLYTRTHSALRPACIVFIQINWIICRLMCLLHFYWSFSRVRAAAAVLPLNGSFRGRTVLLPQVSCMHIICFESACVTLWRHRRRDAETSGERRLRHAEPKTTGGGGGDAGHQYASPPHTHPYQLVGWCTRVQRRRVWICAFAQVPLAPYVRGVQRASEMRAPKCVYLFIV